MGRTVPWEDCLNQSNVNSCWNLFKYFLTNAINKHAPTIERKIRGDENPWMTRNITEYEHS